MDQTTQTTPEMHSVTSSQIEAIGYEPEAKELHVRFKGGSHYKYFDVPASLWLDFQKAESKGSFFHAHVKKGGFEFARLSNGA